ncbi:MAG: glycosyltransferase [Candidatus Babeliales bacterium]
MSSKNSSYSHWVKKNSYYHHYILSLYRSLIPAHQTVLQVGCKNGFVVKNIKAAQAVGIESDSKALQEALDTISHHAFYSSLEQVPVQTFDYIILSSSTHETDDVQNLLQQLQPYCSQKTRIIVDFYSFLWEPTLRVLQKLGFRRPTPLKNWLSFYDIKNFLYLAGFEVITHQRKMLIPCYIPLISWVFNSFIANIPLINRLCLMEFIVARPLVPKKEPALFKASVIIPCRNEKGNIEPAVLRCPLMGKETEIIFVEGNSKDGTVEEIERIIKKYPEKTIKFLKQDGKGKGDAVRKGFEHATGDILMIQDADLTAPPEELPKFFNALIEGQGEFINGSRLIYGMEEKAMRFLNMIANHGFALGFSWLLGQRVKDTLCGTKVLFKKDYEKIAANRHYFGEFDPFGDFDLLFGAAKQNLKIIDLPVHYKQRTYGSTQIRRFYHGLLLVKMSIIGLKKFKLY